MKQVGYQFCMKQFKPAIIVIVLLAIVVVGWTAYHERGHRRRGMMAMINRSGIMPTATAPPIRFGATAPHPDWGACDNCHDVFRGNPAAGPKQPPAGMRAATAPPISPTQKAPHADWGKCTNCHDIITPTGKTTAPMTIATAPPIRAGQKPPHPDWGHCTVCHDVVGTGGTQAAAMMQVASVIPPLGGLWLRPITPATADRLGLENTDGVLVSGVQDPSTAHDAGFQVGDVILRIDNQKVDGINDARVLMADKNPLDTVRFQILRNKRHMKILVTIPAGAKNQGDFFQAVQAAAPLAQPSRLAVAATGRDPGAQVAPLYSQARVFFIYDAQTGQYTAMDIPVAGTLTAGQQVTAQLINAGVGAVIVGNIGPASALRLRRAGISVYSGVFGSVKNAVAQYRQGRLVAAAGTALPAPSPSGAAALHNMSGKIAVASNGAALTSTVAADLGQAPYLIFYNPATGAADAVAKSPAPDQGTNSTQTAQLIVDQGAIAVISGNISPQSVQTLSTLGVFAFAGVQGTVNQALQMYQNGQLRVTTATGSAPRNLVQAPQALPQENPGVNL